MRTLAAEIKHSAENTVQWQHNCPYACSAVIAA